MRLKIMKKWVLRASTLMEALVALAITSIVMWMVFTSMEYRLLPVNPQRKLDALFIADSLLQQPYNIGDSLNIEVRNFTVKINASPYKDSSPQAGIINIDVYATPKHVLVNRQKIVLYETEE